MCIFKKMNGIYMVYLKKILYRFNKKFPSLTSNAAQWEGSGHEPNS